MLGNDARDRRMTRRVVAMRFRNRLMILVVLSLLLPGVFAHTTTVAQDTSIPVLNFGGMGGGSNPQPNYNPYSPNKLSGTENLVYEKLYIVNGYNCEQVPWLATAYEW